MGAKPKKSQQNMIAILIFGVGLAALLFVGYQAYQRFAPASNIQKAADQQQMVEMSAQENAVNSNPAAKAKPKNPNQDKILSRETARELAEAKRQKDIKEKQITGAWDMYTGRGRILLQLQRGKYEVIYIPDNVGAYRYFSKGNYTMEEDIVTFTPDVALDPPQSDLFRYQIMTRSPFPVMASTYKDSLVMERPPADIGIYVPNDHPLIDLTRDNIAVFNVLK